MNNIEHDILAGCLHVIYRQMLTQRAEPALESVERLTSLIRYMAKSSSQSTLGDELCAIQNVFQILQADEIDPIFTIDCSGADPQTAVRCKSIVYEVCQHGAELIHNGYHFENLTFFQQHGQLRYTFTNTAGSTYGGTINDDKTDAGPEA